MDLRRKKNLQSSEFNILGKNNRIIKKEKKDLSILKRTFQVRSLG